MRDSDKNNDYEFARETLYDMICKGREGVEEMIEVAKSSEHPRAYEVLAKLIKDTSDVSTQLLGLHKQIKEIEKEETLSLPQSGDTTNVFIGSTTDLQRALKELKEKEINVPHDEITHTRHDQE